MFEKIKYYYSAGLYTDRHLKKLLAVGAITNEEFNQINGDL